MYRQLKTRDQIIASDRYLWPVLLNPYRGVGGVRPVSLPLCRPLRQSHSQNSYPDCSQGDTQ